MLKTFNFLGPSRVCRCETITTLVCSNHETRNFDMLTIYRAIIPSRMRYGWHAKRD